MWRWGNLSWTRTQASCSNSSGREQDHNLMQPTVRRARRTADTRGYADRERAARWGRPRPEHPPGFVEIAGCGSEERGPDQRQAGRHGRAPRSRRPSPDALPSRLEPGPRRPEVPDDRVVVEVLL